jgi:hypothetical protein
VPHLRHGFIAINVGHFRGSENPDIHARYWVQGRSVARSSKLMILLPLFPPQIFFCHFLPKNRMSSPKMA